MLINEIKKSNTDPNITRVINYLCDLSAETGIPIDSWDIHKVFGDELSYVVRDLNKKFFAYSSQKARLDRSTLPEDTKSKILALSPVFLSSEIGNLNSYILNKQRDIESYQNSINASISELVGYRDRIKAIESRKATLLTEVQTIVDSGFWELISVSSLDHDAIRFRSNEIVLKMPMDDERDFKTPFGRLDFVIRRDGSVVAMPNNRQSLSRSWVSNYFHPYINQSGSICWGSAKSVAQQFIAERRYADAFSILQQLLTTYSVETTPYVTLDKFFLEGRDLNGKYEWRQGLSPELNKLYGLGDNGSAITRRVHCTGYYEDDDGNERECNNEWDSDAIVGQYDECEMCGSEIRISEDM